MGVVVVVVVLVVLVVTNENKVNPRFCLRLLLGFDNMSSISIHVCFF